MATKPRRVATMLDLQWPFKRHLGIFAGCQKYAFERDWETTVDEFAGDALATVHMKSVPYDGIIARATPKLALHAERLHIPLVNVWVSSPVAEQLPGVFPDFSAMGRLRAEHLLSRGLCHFASLTANDDLANALEMKAFRNTLGEAGFSCIECKISLASSDTFAARQKAEQKIYTWMKHWQPPIGVYVGFTEFSSGLAQKCRNHGWRVPEDVAIITGENEVTLCELVRPTLSSVEVGYERIGYKAARLLDRLMNGQPPPTEHLLLPPVGLVVRESTDFFAVDDEVVTTALKFIAMNAHRRIGADDVAKAVDTETRTLQRYFRKHLDRPIATEIRRVRIERASRELTQSKHSLAQIAHNVGFGKAVRMSDVFNRELGMTPSEFRKQRQMDGQI